MRPGPDRTDELCRKVATGGRGAQTLRAVFALVRADAGRGGPELRALAARLGGPPGAIVKSAAFLVEHDVDGLIAEMSVDPLLARFSPRAFHHLSTVPSGCARLFAAWGAELSRTAPTLGVTAFRAYLGDVAEAAFRSLQHGARADELLGELREFLIDQLSAELPGTTDFLAARGMAWLLGALAANDDAARAALERASARFRDPEFRRDCEAMLEGQPWPPRAG